MSDQFKELDHKAASYHRPNQDWKCGGAATCHPCFLGPARGGKCRAGMVIEGRRSGECLPRRVGDRWRCTRQESHGGEPCSDGPLPDGSCCRDVPHCQPRLAQRAQRGRLVRVVSILTLGVILVLSGASTRLHDNALAGLDPGPLTIAHAGLQTNCGDCHSDLSLSPTSAIHFHVGIYHRRAIEDGKLCLSCHTDIGEKDGVFAFSPHSTNPAILRRPPLDPSRENIGGGVTKAAASISSPVLKKGEVACRVCHSEHHGREFNIMAMTDRQCQVCHRQQFHSFADGHPGFEETKYPYKRRTGIYFNHLTHYETHFKETKNPSLIPAGYRPEARHEESQSCAACHVPDARGELMRVRPFEVSCMQCHSDSVYAGRPLAVIAFPEVDTDTLEAALVSPGQDPPRSPGFWPGGTSEDFPFPLLEMLEPGGLRGWETLAGNGVSPAQLEDADAVSIEAAEKFLWAVKKLFHDIARESPEGKSGHDELVRRLEANGHATSAALLAGLPPDSFSRLREYLGAGDWQTLETEVRTHRERGFLPPPENAGKKEEPVPAPAAIPDAGGTKGAESFAPPSAAAESFGDVPPMERTAGGAESFGAPAPTESFGASPAQEKAEGGAESFGGTKGGSESFGGTPPGESFGAETRKATPGVKETPPAAKLAALDLQPWTAAGGWHQEYGAIYYKSTGHADPFIKAWLDAAVARPGRPSSRAILRETFDFGRGVDSTASGKCFYCHTLEEKKDEKGMLTGAAINWQSYGRSAIQNGTVTRFSHAAHVLQKDCRDCHAIELSRESMGAYAGSYPSEDSWDPETGWFKKTDPHVFHGGFKEMQKNACASCHDSGKPGGNDCTACHTYHRSTWLPGQDHFMEMLKGRQRERREGKAAPGP